MTRSSQGNMEVEKAGLPYATANQRRSIPRSAKLRRLLSYTALVSTALTLSYIVPSPLSLWKAERAETVAAAPEWKDNVWPLREQAPWDISTDLSHPRRLEYDVEEGTWLRLDVHPKSGDIVFDMVGDIYCLPGGEALQMDFSQTINARPVLVGVPHDSDPHFSPTGDRLVFRSDAGLGLENIWVVEWKGCDAMDLKGPAFISGQETRKPVRDGECEEERKERLLKEGRLNAIRVTNETYRWVSDARFHPSGEEVIATKWYTSSRSLGAGEGWSYPVPSIEEIREGQKPVRVASGDKLVGRSLPLGWSQDQYGDQQIGPEQFIWLGTDSVIYSKNVKDSSAFEYSKDVHSGIYAIFKHNFTTSATDLLVDAFPGGASRPELSRDRQTLAYVNRVRDKEALVFKDLLTGSIHHIWYGLTYDLSTISAPMGTYPSFAFTPEDDAVIIWAAGKIYRVPVSKNAQGERVAGGRPQPIPFKAHIEKQLAETLKGGADILDLETRDEQRIAAFKELRVDEDGQKAVFQAAGVTYVHTSGQDHPVTVPVLEPNASYYSPSFIWGRDSLVLHARWSDATYTTFEIADLEFGIAYRLEGIPIGRYFAATFDETGERRRQIAFVKSGGDDFSGKILATAGPGLYIGEVILPSPKTRYPIVRVRKINFIPSDIDPNDRVQLRFIDNSKKLLVQQSSSVFVIDLQGSTDKGGKPKHSTIASGEMSTELAATTKNHWGKFVVDNLAFVEGFHVYFVPGRFVKGNEKVWSRPADATKGLVRLSLDGGHDVTWSRDGKKLFWFLGPFLHSLEIEKLKECAKDIHDDHLTFGIGCVKGLLEYKELVVTHSTDIARLKKEASSLALGSVATSNSDVLVLLNATLLTMHNGNEEEDLIRDAVLSVRGGVIEYTGPSDGYVVPEGAAAIDVAGGFVTPGFIDVHAHWNGFSTRFPVKSWEMQTFLAYGVTTLHNPSASNVDGFVERGRVEGGQMIGPRIFTVGDVIYGAGEPSLHQDIADMDEARAALIRIKAEGGPASLSYKNYNLPSRASRQRLIKVARDLKMLCVPEGGMNYDWDLTYIIDGMTTVEHSIPVPVLYEDVRTLFALSGTGNTPTHLVNYGGAFGEQLVWATNNLPNDPKLRRFTPHDILQALSESTSRPANSYALFNTSASVAKMVSKGLLANIGAHGEPPLGLNYHAEMAFAAAGGLDNYEVFRAATSSGAKTLGIFSSLGSLSAGKLADFVVYPPDVDILSARFGKESQNIMLVARGGRVWQADTMVEVWPKKGRKEKTPIINAD